MTGSNVPNRTALDMLYRDLTDINFTYLLLAREVSRTSPLLAIRMFGVNEDQINQISVLPIERIRALAACGHALLSKLPLDAPHNAPIAMHTALLRSVEA